MNDAIQFDFLDDLQRSGIVLGLERIVPLLAQLDNPQEGFRSVLIAGTNGKGSTAAFLESILRCAGIRTGLFTSPHLVDVRERIRVNGEVLDAARFVEYGREVRRAMESTGTGRATYFETLTAMGFLTFAREGVDVAVVEAGMGGRYDSTNALDPDVSVLTNVSLDHQMFLGERLEDIAAEKVCVARKERAFITGVDDRVYDAVVGPALLRLGALPCRMGRDFHVTRSDGVIHWQGRTQAIEDASLSLKGTFQSDNAALALAAAEALEALGLTIGGDGMREGIRTAVWPGRFQRVAERPNLILDGCHNPGAADRLLETLTAYPESPPLVLVHGSKPQKDFRDVLSRILPLADHCIETTIPGLAGTGELARAARESARCPVEEVPEFPQALERARVKAGQDGTVLVTGSLHLVGAALMELDGS